MSEFITTCAVCGKKFDLMKQKTCSHFEYYTRITDGDWEFCPKCTKKVLKLLKILKKEAEQ